MSTFTRILGLEKKTEVEDEGLERLRRVLRQDPRSLQFVPLADACRKRGLFDEAVSVCQQGLSYHPNYVSGIVALARTFQEAGDSARAIDAYLRVVALSPENLVGHLALADLYEHNGAAVSAWEHFVHARRLGATAPELPGRIQRLERVLAEAGVTVVTEAGTGAPHAMPGDERALRARISALEAYRARMAMLAT